MNNILCYTEYNGSYLHKKSGQRPKKNIIAVLDLFMQFDEYPDVYRVFDKYRCFGHELVQTEDYVKWERWAITPVSDLFYQDQILLPLTRIERKLLYESQTYHDELKVRGSDEKVPVDWSSDESFAGDMSKIIALLKKQMAVYKENKEGNEEQEEKKEEEQELKTDENKEEKEEEEDNHNDNRNHNNNQEREQARSDDDMDLAIESDDEQTESEIGPSQEQRQEIKKKKRGNRKRKTLEFENNIDPLEQSRIVKRARHSSSTTSNRKQKSKQYSPTRKRSSYNPSNAIKPIPIPSQHNEEIDQVCQ